MAKGAGMSPHVIARVKAVAAGHAQFSTLSPEERTAAHALIDREIQERAARQRFGRAAGTDEHPAD